MKSKFKYDLEEGGTNFAFHKPIFYLWGQIRPKHISFPNPHKHIKD